MIKSKLAPHPSKAKYRDFWYEPQPGDARIVAAAGQPLVCIAQHEAAHAVTALALGASVLRLTLRLPRPQVIVRDAESARASAAIALSGLIIDYYQLDQPIDFGGELPLNSDESRVWAWAQASVGHFDLRAMTARIKDLTAATQLVMAANNAAILGVTRAVLSAPSRSLNAAEITRAAGRVTRIDPATLTLAAKAA